MYQIHSDQKKARIITWVAISSTVVILAAVLLWWLNRDSSVNARIDSIPQSGEKTMRGTDFEKGQVAAASAAIAGKPITGTVLQRPDFVSEFEWQVLQNFAGKQPNSGGKQLTDLVNKLLFAKKREAWIASPQDSARRLVLAQQLLEMIPAQVEGRALDPATAKRMERELNVELRKQNINPLDTSCRGHDLLIIKN
jgi:hypothetical protein